MPPNLQAALHAGVTHAHRSASKAVALVEDASSTKLHSPRTRDSETGTAEHLRHFWNGGTSQVPFATYSSQLNE